MVLSTEIVILLALESRFGYLPSQLMVHSTKQTPQDLIMYLRIIDTGIPGQDQYHMLV